ncbi:MAG: DUF4149 domain-containing protein [Planctomycetia bacterium]|nr:DUF4149 domain-containing protein [Planctomycetia bacterium]
MFRALATLRTVALGAWFGGAAAIALLVAPSAFRALAPDRVSAGAAVGASLHAFEYASFALLGVALAASLLLRWRKQPSLLCDAAIALLLLGTVLLAAWLSPALAAARPAGTGDGTEFQRLHRLYERIFGFELLVALAAFTLSAMIGSGKKAGGG